MLYSAFNSIFRLALNSFDNCLFYSAKFKDALFTLEHAFLFIGVLSLCTLSRFYKTPIAGSNIVFFLNNEKTFVDWSFQVAFIFSDQILPIVIFQKGEGMSQELDRRKLVNDN